MDKKYILNLRRLERAQKQLELAVNSGYLFDRNCSEEDTESAAKGALLLTILATHLMRKGINRRKQR